MTILLQRFWHTNVVRESEQFIIAKTTYMDNWEEKAAVLKVQVNSFKIEEAWLERLGRPGGSSESRQYIKNLNGIEAYLGSGPKLREALNEVSNESERALFNHSVTGIVQAETFLFKERGYDNASQYSEAWEKFFAGSCNYYSNLERAHNSWKDYIGTMDRKTNLFDRCQSQYLIQDEDSYLLYGSLIDSFHQVNTTLKLNNEMKIISAQGQLLRGPDALCREATMHMKNILGQSLPGKTKKEIAITLGAGQGCVHLIDLTYESVKTLELYNSQK